MNWPGEKLCIAMWTTLAEKGVGGLLAPWQIGRVGAARIATQKDELLALAHAKREALLIEQGASFYSAGSSTYPNASNKVAPPRIEPVMPLEHVVAITRSASDNDQLRREVNVAGAILQAEEVLKRDSRELPEKQMGADWLYRWRDYAGEVSSEDLQELWGKALAGELMAPGTHSLRLLEFLRNLSSDEASKIAKIASFVLNNKNLIRLANKANRLGQAAEDAGLTFGILLELEELGVLTGVPSGSLKNTYSTLSKQSFIYVFESYGRGIVVKHADPSKKLELEVYRITPVGSQLLSLGGFTANEPLLREVGQHISSLGFDVSICSTTRQNHNEILITNEEPISNETNPS